MADQATPVKITYADTPEQEPEANGATSRYLRPDELLSKWSISLTNAKDPGILGVMTKYGYDAKRIDEGADLHARVTGLFIRQKKEYGEQLEASAELSSAFDKANAAHMTSIKVARIVFEGDTNAFVSLLLAGPRSKLISPWIKQAETFYVNLIANQAFIGKMAYFGYTADKLREEHKLVLDVTAANAKHKKEMGESQEARVVRDDELAELEDWMSKFYRIARIACAGHDQWLEKLGLKE